MDSQNQKKDTTSLFHSSGRKILIDHLMKNVIEPIIEKLPKDGKKYHKSETDEDLLVIVYGIVERLKQSANDFQALQYVMEYMLRQPIYLQTNDEVISLGQYLNVSASDNVPVQPKSLNPYDAFNHPNKIGFLVAMYQDILKIFQQQNKNISAWNFKYPLNQQGEIMTQGLGEWQADRMEMPMNKDPLASYGDFSRDLPVDGFNAYQFYLIAMPSLPTPEELENLIQKTHGACIICTSDKIYYVHDPVDTVDVIPLDSNELDYFIATFNPTTDLKMITLNQLTEFSENFSNFSMMTFQKPLDDIITWNIHHACAKLNLPENETTLMEAWLKMNGNQQITRYIQESFVEGHFSPEDSPPVSFSGFSNILDQGWKVIEIEKDNHTEYKMAFFYKIELLSIMQDRDPYIREKDGFLHRIEPHDLADRMKQDKPDPVMFIDSALILDVEKNNNGKLVVKPKLIKFEVDCYASLSDAGNVIIQTPNNNRALLSQLKSNDKEIQTDKKQIHKTF